ncbi:MAG: hypothetical protein ACRCVV_21945 [Shewanella sp.]
MSYLQILCIVLGMVIYVLANHVLKLQRERVKLICDLDVREIILKRISIKNPKLVSDTIKEIIKEREAELGE